MEAGGGPNAQLLVQYEDGRAAEWLDAGTERGADFRRVYWEPPVPPWLEVCLAYSTPARPCSAPCPCRT